MQDSNTYSENLEVNTKLNLTIPRSSNAEQVILGGVLSNNELLFEVYSIICEKDFYKNAHKIIYKAILRLIKNNDRAASLAVAEQQLKKSDQLTRAAGRDYLIKLIESTPASKNVESYVNIVKVNSAQRKIYAASRKIGEIALQPGDLSHESMINEIEKVFFCSCTVARRKY